MDPAIARLKQRFTEPAPEVVEKNNKCTICWSDYDEKDRPIKLPVSIPSEASGHASPFHLTFPIVLFCCVGELDANSPSSQCGHIFGESCILTWARHTASDGSYQGCPFCQARLLSPPLRSRVTAALSWLGREWRVLQVFYGGLRGLAFGLFLHTASIALIIASFTLSWVKDPKLYRAVWLGLRVCEILYASWRISKFTGWRRVVWHAVVNMLIFFPVVLIF